MGHIWPAGLEDLTHPQANWSERHIALSGLDIGVEPELEHRYPPYGVHRAAGYWRLTHRRDRSNGHYRHDLDPRAPRRNRAIARRDRLDVARQSWVGARLVRV